MSLGYLTFRWAGTRRLKADALGRRPGLRFRVGGGDSQEEQPQHVQSPMSPAPPGPWASSEVLYSHACFSEHPADVGTGTCLTHQDFVCPHPPGPGTVASTPLLSRVVAAASGDYSWGSHRGCLWAAPGAAALLQTSACSWSRCQASSQAWRVTERPAGGQPRVGAKAVLT